MHPLFSETMLRDNQRNLDRALKRAYLRRGRGPAVAPPSETVVLRLCCVKDDGALERLAALEGAPSPKGAYVVAEVNGAVVAALPLGPGPALADPFRRTAHLIPLLELRARQLTDERSRGRLHPLWGVVRGSSGA